MSNTRRYAGALIALSLSVAALTGCVSRGQDTATADAPALVSNEDLSTVTLNVGDQKGGTEALLKASGQLDGTAYQVAFSTFTSGPPQVEAATAGQIDFAVTGNTPPVFGVAANARIKIVSAYSNNASGDQILVPANSTLTSFADLRGKKIAVGKGSSAHGHVLLQLQKAGLTDKDVQLVFLQPADAGTAFAAAQVDAWAIWDPYTAITQVQTGAKTLTTAEGVANGYGFGIASQQALDDPKKNTALQDLVVRLAKASAWAKDNPAVWAADYSAAVGIDPKAGELAQGRSQRPAIALDAAVIDSEQKLYDAFVESGSIPGGNEFADFVDTRYADAIGSAT
ncbi:sulfonate ABC transporter periplasmic sulfonate-binding protein SsuA [Rhodococcoides trifolii]|uniref:Putative aliphatic sulfonates-binding protein n=1 Tax=Rhodococcoides trifolii TaxID=908250 RepID=A0A917FQ02_9NOCA|nr:ABC transporter substrate-binding protein [Rhodococcus trifolii]GGF94090.1 sulfonate ABC transporter periplasmic sulfonate-binding protein SsuA [Rhodococcus trifolii]